MEQGRRPEQMEYSAKASFYCILIAFLLAITFSVIQPFFPDEIGALELAVKNITAIEAN
ncbi:hypothetical protein [Pedobacter agri]|uniref:hypothetical protein n=1 Tax=Pedobacter agri TaxID=454586 RepID=UPI0029318E5A|nr:hypothetical protein [Pedobacter agri]